MRVAIRQKSDKFKISRYSPKRTIEGVEIVSKEATISVTIPFGPEVIKMSYKYPRNLQAWKELFAEIYFEWAILNGYTTEEAFNFFYDLSDEEKESLSALQVLPKASKSSVELKEGIKALVDVIQQENDLTRYQARHVFSELFASGVPFATKDGALIEEAIERTRSFMTEEKRREVAQVEAPSYNGPVYASEGVPENVVQDTSVFRMNNSTGTYIPVSGDDSSEESVEDE